MCSAAPLAELLKRSDEPAAREELYRLVYVHLRSQASRILSGGDSSPTSLVNESYLRLFGRGPRCFEGESHFFGAAALAMRSILVDAARARCRIKRKATGHRVGLETVLLKYEENFGDLLDLHEALNALQDQDAGLYDIALLRIFADLTHQEIAEIVGCCTRTIEERWRFIRAWLKRAML